MEDYPDYSHPTDEPTWKGVVWAAWRMCHPTTREGRMKLREPTSPLAKEVWYIVQQAEINATDTAGETGYHYPHPMWFNVAIASVGCLVDAYTSDECCQWMRDHGITW